MLLLGLICLLLPASGWAGFDPYQVAVPVPDQSASARRSAEREGLRRILVRLSGDADIASRDAIAAALRAPQDYFQRSGFARIRDPELAAAHPDARWLLELEADQTGVLGLLAEAGVPAWTGRRPQLLVVILREEADGERQILDGRSAEARALLAMGQERGLPLSVPLLDLEDRLALDATALWAGFEGATEALEARYQPDAVVVLRLYQDALGRWVADWEGEVAGERFAAAWEVEQPEAGARQLVDRLSARLTARYALRLGDDADSVWLQVDDLPAVEAYAGVLRYLSGVSGISRVQVVRVRQRSLLLRLDSSDDADRLLDLLRLEAQLPPQKEPEFVGDVAVWRARWQGGRG